MKKPILSGVLLLALSACGVSTASDEDRHIVEGSRTIIHPKGDFDEESARADAIADVSDQTFSDVGDTASCTTDCSGHEAGFEWAKDNSPEDADACGDGENESFNDGCQAFHTAVDAQVERSRDAWENGEEP